MVSRMTWDYQRSLRNGGKIQNHDSNEHRTDKKLKTEITEKLLFTQLKKKRTIKQALETFSPSKWAGLNVG